MNTVAGNAALVTPIDTTLQHHTCSTSPIGEQRLEVAAGPALEAVSPAPILIIEQEVVFSTAAAMPLRPKTIHWWSEMTGVAFGSVHRMFLSSTPDARQPRQYYPKRYEFLEHSCMAREMDRL